MLKDISGIIFKAVADEIIDGVMDKRVESASKGKFKNWNEFESWFDSNKENLDKNL